MHKVVRDGMWDINEQYEHKLRNCGITANHQFLKSSFSLVLTCQNAYSVYPISGEIKKQLLSIKNLIFSLKYKNQK